MKLKNQKKCWCGAVHVVIPVGAKVQFSGDELSGYYWNCACGTTLFAPLWSVT